MGRERLKCSCRGKNKGKVYFSTYINASVWGSKKDEWDRDLDFGRASIINFGRFCVVLPEWIETRHGVSCKEREERVLIAMSGPVLTSERPRRGPRGCLSPKVDLLRRAKSLPCPQLLPRCGRTGDAEGLLATSLHLSHARLWARGEILCCVLVAAD